VDFKTLARAYDRSAASYDDRFRALQRPKYEAAARLLGGLAAGTRCLDAGGGTGLFAEFAPALRVTVLDASLAMLRVAARRAAERERSTQRPGQQIALAGQPIAPAGQPIALAGQGGSLWCVLGDLSAPPFPPRSFPLVVSFTAVLGDAPRSLRALGALVSPGGRLVLSFLASEAPPAAQIARHTGLGLVAGPARAGQDDVTVLAALAEGR
jgi:SAM-dependent methyltransferase